MAGALLSILNPVREPPFEHPSGHHLEWPSPSMQMRGMELLSDVAMRKSLDMEAPEKISKTDVSSADVSSPYARKKARHRSHEQKRRNRINDSINELRILVEAAQGSTVRQDKASVLCASIDYIKESQYVIKQLRERVTQSQHVRPQPLGHNSCVDFSFLPSVPYPLHDDGSALSGNVSRLLSGDSRRSDAQLRFHSLYYPSVLSSMPVASSNPAAVMDQPPSDCSSADEGSFESHNRSKTWSNSSTNSSADQLPRLESVVSSPGSIPSPCISSPTNGQY
mmetsp:Transcript_15200/g.25041  ORF Transcript_15200/g.25041 Transcript_15200/m.25041 type:complete len:280 (-) Transcript_15200:452-1291(-)